MRIRYITRTRLAAGMLGVAIAGPLWAQSIPRIPELAQDRWNFDSPLWEKAGKAADFKVPGDNIAAAEKTEVRLAHDGEYLFVRFTASDAGIASRKQAELDEFADDFPQGDHGEIWNTLAGPQVFAFDAAGNKYDALSYDRRHTTGFRTKARVTAEGWQSIVVIPLKKLFRNEIGKALQLAFVRHFAGADASVVRSTASGQPEYVRANYNLE